MPAPPAPCLHCKMPRQNPLDSHLPSSSTVREPCPNFAGYNSMPPDVYPGCGAQWQTEKLNPDYALVPKPHSPKHVAAGRDFENTPGNRVRKSAFPDCLKFCRFAAIDRKDGCRHFLPRLRLRDVSAKVLHSRDWPDIFLLTLVLQKLSVDLGQSLRECRTRSRAIPV